MSDPPCPQGLDSESLEWWDDVDFGQGMRQSFRVRRLHSEQTEYQRIEVLENPHLGRILALDGIVQLTQRDEFVYHEMMAHVPLCGRKAAGSPASVLIIGGGDGGTLREVLRHPEVERVVMVEIDGAVVEVTARLLGVAGDYEDPRVDLRIADGTAFVRSEEARAAPFDVVVIDSTDPVGPGAALFTDAFMADLVACMTSDGVMVRQAGLPFLEPDAFARTAAQARPAFACDEVFHCNIPTYYGGNMAFVVGLCGGGTLARPRLEWSGRHYNPAVHAAAFALPTWLADLARPGARDSR
ncbi:MAG: polyamine aminopropyltransferase [Myxococcota bacterium]